MPPGCGVAGRLTWVFSEPPRKARASPRTITDSETLPHRPATPFHTIHHAASLWDPAWMKASAASRHTPAGAGGSSRSCRPPVPSPEHTVQRRPSDCTEPAPAACLTTCRESSRDEPGAPRPERQACEQSTPTTVIDPRTALRIVLRLPSRGAACPRHTGARPATPRRSQTAAGTNRPTPRCSETLRASVNSETRESPLDTPGR
jgi:hypothetical protein